MEDREEQKVGLEWRDLRVCVTGGSGFIGQHLLAELLALGAKPVSVSRRKPSELNEPELATAVEWCEADLTTESAAQSLLKQISPDVVFHLAGMVKGTRDRAAVLPMLEGNVRQLISLMDAAVECGCRRFVQAGSLEEPDDLLASPASPYAVSKMAASAYARLYREHYGLETAVARIFMVYGPGVQDQNKLVPYVIQALLGEERPQLSGGTRPVDWIHVRDVARGLIALAESGASEAELGSGELHTVRDVVAEIYRQFDLEAELEGNSPFGALTDRAAERVRKAELGRNAGLDWKPTVKLEQGLVEATEWFRAQRVR